MNTIDLNKTENGTTENGKTTEDRLLSTKLVRTDFFATDKTDEFKITKENGEVLGIFKVWAENIIPLLETIDIEEIETEKRSQITKLWTTKMRENPLSLFQCLEEWRTISEIFDKRLQEIFFEEDANSKNLDPIEKFVETFLRLETAFKFAAPFYNIEALVADSRPETNDNPIILDQNCTKGGELDIVALCLPSVLIDGIKAESGNFNGLNWEIINNIFNSWKESFLSGKKSKESELFKILCTVADRAGRNPIEILFVANAMEFIPPRVAGKKNDLPWEEALQIIREKLSSNISTNPSTTTIAREINAKIRFLNWCPAEIDSQNFDGKFWNYSSVCDTSGSLFSQILRDPKTFLNKEFADIFTEKLAIQLEEIDASSARGRFILQLVLDGKILPEILEKIEEQRPKFQKKISQKLKKIKEKEILLPLEKARLTLLAGGKASGLLKAGEIFGKEKILDGFVLSSEAINDWLQSIPEIAKLINELEESDNIEKKKLVAETIVQLIQKNQIPNIILSSISNKFKNGDKVALRSSCFDEDVDMIGPAPGIYESILDSNPFASRNLEDAIKSVICSFFSPKAICFRELKGIRHKPRMAILIQKFIKNTGGTVFCKNGNITINIANRPDLITHQNSEFEEFEIKDTSKLPESKLITQKQLTEITNIVLLAEQIFGPIDLEFVIDPENSQIKILQLRKLQGIMENIMNETSKKNEENIKDVFIGKIEELVDLTDDSPVNLCLSSTIDIEKFQGLLFMWIIKNNTKIHSITLENSIPMTCHFANIVLSLGIKILTK
ncbi:MAG: PEP/pyruvate-binding domain-containing protein [Candidatus Gracilibacteria bacterium]|jgi:hypothetical protein|nr:PEP/pyruvate-binding domain-containing protein [Candidatus Gracilibacteria bacterium]